MFSPRMHAWFVDYAFYDRVVASFVLCPSAREGIVSKAHHGIEAQAESRGRDAHQALIITMDVPCIIRCPDGV